MTELGLFLSGEEHAGSCLARQAQEAEDAGFGSVLISDHYHPWLDEQGHSPFVWAVLGAIAQETRLRITTGVTCPTVRTHPAVIAQAAATVAEMCEGRFRLGVGSGEALNEHIIGGRWPPADVRLEMLEEAVAVMRMMWRGETVTHRGRHYTVEGARIYEKPPEQIPVVVSGFGPKAVGLAARIGDGYITVQPDGESVNRYRGAGGQGPVLGGLKMCFGPDRDQAVALAYRRWRSDSLPGELNQILPSPAHFEQVSQLITEDQAASSIPCGPDPEPYVKAIQTFVDAGFDELYVNQIGEDLQGFLSFFDQYVRPHLTLA